jgi:hypothetical protein
MKLILIYLMLIILPLVSSEAQTIPDSEFEWINNEACLSLDPNTKVFLKVEQDPFLSEFNKSSFDQFIEHLVNDLDLDKTQDGFIKLKVLFAQGQSLCVSQVGTKSIQLNTAQVNEINNRFSEIHEFELGRQRGRPVDCLGILYIEVLKGVLVSTRNVNFGFH